jgi:hypothetical protein
MAKPNVSELLLHNFPENGVKYLLHNPGNLQDLLHLLARRHPALPNPRSFHCARRVIEPDSLIRGDYSHGVTDLLLRLPFGVGGREEAWIQVYLLVEHLSTHQRHIVPRSLGYALDVYRLQERRWLETHDKLQGLLYEAVLPIVIYTGERPWRTPVPFRELVHGGEVFAPFLPSIEPLFLSLPGQPELELVEQGGVFGTVLHVLQQRHAVFEEFGRFLMQATATIQAQLRKERHRQRELLSYLEALLYHFREPRERHELREMLERSIQDLNIREETQAMGQTIAEALREEGKREGNREGELRGTVRAKQQTLVMLLRRKFGRKVTSVLVTTIERTKDLPTLDTWLGNLLDAQRVEDVGIPGKKQ